MKVRILQCVGGARQAAGIAVVIDVFRASSLECYVLGQGALSIIAVGDLEEAYRLKQDHPEYVLMGERGLRKPRGFDFGNSPSEIQGVDFSGKTVVHTTSHGTQGMVAAAGADEIMVGAFVNAAAVVNHLRRSSAAQVSLVCMGNDNEIEADEDTLCAEYLSQALGGDAPDFSGIKTRLRTSPNGARFLSGLYEWAPPGDFKLCLELDRFDFVIKGLRSAAGQILLKKAGV
jgi:2-phosphosulfolactate phosphatase